VTRLNNSRLLSRLEKPVFADVLHWLVEVKFLTEDEKAAYGAAFGFLSVAHHPGLPDPDMARLCMILAMSLGHACLLKLGSWTRANFRAPALP
jgi:hypothetical protein